MIQRSHDDRMLWAQFDSLEMGSGWDDTDILKPQIMVESVYGDSHPGSTHLNQLVEQAVYGVYEKGGKPAKYYATDICDGCAQGHAHEQGGGKQGKGRVQLDLHDQNHQQGDSDDQKDQESSCRHF